MARTGISPGRRSHQLYGGSLFMDQAGRYAQITTGYTQSFSGCTILVECKPIQRPGSTYMCLYNYSAGALTDGFECTVQVANSSGGHGKLNMFLRVGSVVETHATIGRVKFNEWNHLAFVYDDAANSMYSYFDGVADAQVTAAVLSMTTVTSGTTGIGVRRYGAVNDLFFNGTIARIHKYNRVLTAAEIKAHYETGALPSDSATSLLNRYEFSDMTGTTLTDTGADPKNATLVSTPVWKSDVPSAPRLAPRNFPYSLSFDGVNDSVSFGDILDYTLADSFTLSTWVKVERYAGTFAPLWDKLTSNGSYRQTVGTVGQVGLTLRQSDATIQGVTSFANVVELNKWHFFQCVFTPTIMYIYVDGYLVNQVAVSLSNIGNSSISLYLGFSTNNAFYFCGKMTHSYVFSSALTAAQIRDWYFNNIIPSGAAIALNYTDGSGTTLTDSSGNGRNGTISGATWSSDVPFSGNRTAITTARTAGA